MTRLKRERINEYELRRRAFDLIVQLPPLSDDALYVLSYARRLVRAHLEEKALATPRAPRTPRARSRAAAEARSDNVLDFRPDTGAVKKPV